MGTTYRHLLLSLAHSIQARLVEWGGDAEEVMGGDMHGRGHCVRGEAAMAMTDLLIRGFLFVFSFLLSMCYISCNMPDIIRDTKILWSTVPRLKLLSVKWGYKRYTQESRNYKTIRKIG